MVHIRTIEGFAKTGLNTFKSCRTEATSLPDLLGYMYIFKVAPENK